MGGCFSWLQYGNIFTVYLGNISNLISGHPLSRRDLTEFMRMTFEAGVIAAALVDGEIVLWTGQMKRFDSSLISCIIMA
jgi:hypothetical protein